MTTAPPLTHVFSHGAIYDGLSERLHDTLVVRDGVVVYVGSADAAAPYIPHADVSVHQLHGAALTPGFVDGHAHVEVSALAHLSIDLSTVNGAAELLDRVANTAGRGVGPILGHGWDETAWSDPALPGITQIDRAAQGAEVYLSRADVHSSLVSTALAARAGLHDLPGWNGTAWVTQEATRAARTAIESSQHLDWRQAQDEVLQRALGVGLVGLVECANPQSVQRGSFDALLDLTAAGSRRPLVMALLAQLVDDPQQARDILARHRGRVVGLGGDLSIDGSLGSGTALLRDAYPDGTHGVGYLSPDQVSDHLIATTAAGIQAGFHVIGDHALDIVLNGLKAAAAAHGRARVRAARHRLEHVILAWPEQIEALADCGVIASVQPAFDATWGAPTGQYQQRLGSARLGHTHRFRDLVTAGIPLALGSDAPVTPLAPWAGVQASLAHHDPSQRLSATEAFAAHTRGGWESVGAKPRADRRGILAPGAPAHAVVWEHGNDPHAATSNELLRLLAATQPAARLVTIGGDVVYENRH